MTASSRRIAGWLLAGVALLGGLLFWSTQDAGTLGAGPPDRTDSDRADVESPPSRDDRTLSEFPEGERSALEPVQGEPQPQPSAAAEVHRRIVGVVRRADGTPLTAASIESVTVAWGRTGNVSELVRIGAARSPVGRTRTGADGRFEVLDPLAGHVMVEATAPGFLPLVHAVYVPNTGPDLDVGTLTLRRGVHLSGQVVDARGDPVPDARLILPAPEGRKLFYAQLWAAREVARTSADGTFRTEAIPHGSWALEVEAEGHPPHSVGGSTVHESTEGLRIVLPLGLSITGTVSVADAVAIEDLNVEIRLSKDQRDHYGIEGDFDLLAPCAADGSFELTAIPFMLSGERLQLGVRHDSRWFEELVTPVSARPGERDVRLELKAPFLVTFGLRDARTGAALPAPRVHGERWVDGEFVGGSDSRVDDLGAGRHRIRLMTGAPWSYRLRIEPAGHVSYYSTPIESGPGGSADLGWIDFEPRPVQCVRVVDRVTRAPVENATVYAVRASAVPSGPRDPRPYARLESSSFYTHSWESGVTDAEGRTCVPWSADGDHLLVAAHLSYAPSHALELSDPTAREEFEIELDPAGTLRITVTKDSLPLVGVHFESICDHVGPTHEILSQTPFQREYMMTDPGGVGVIERLAPGRHLFLAEELDQLIVEVDVVEPTLYERTINY